MKKNFWLLRWDANANSQPFGSKINASTRWAIETGIFVQKSKSIDYTVIINLARNGRTRAVKFRPKNFPKSANSSAEQWTKFAQIGRVSPEIFEGEPQLRGFAHFEQVSPKKNYCVLLEYE
jgi:hypothetical protein